MLTDIKQVRWRHRHQAEQNPNTQNPNTQNHTTQKCSWDINLQVDCFWFCFVSFLEIKKEEKELANTLTPPLILGEGNHPLLSLQMWGPVRYRAKVSATSLLRVLPASTDSKHQNKIVDLPKARYKHICIHFLKKLLLTEICCSSWDTQAANQLLELKSLSPLFFSISGSS